MTTCTALRFLLKDLNQMDLGFFVRETISKICELNLWGFQGIESYIFGVSHTRLKDNIHVRVMNRKDNYHITHEV